MHTRTLRYGKLGEGILVRVRSSLVERTKNHFHSLPCGASVIRGCNGAIWISPSSSSSLDSNTVDTGGYAKNIESVNLEVRKAIVRLSNCVRILNQLGLNISDTSIMEIYELSSNYEVHELIQPDVIQRLGKNLQQHAFAHDADLNNQIKKSLDLMSHDMAE